MGCRRLKAFFGRYPDAEVCSFLHTGSLFDQSPSHFVIEAIFYVIQHIVSLLRRKNLYSLLFIVL